MTTPASPNSRERVSGPGARLAQARKDLRLGLDEVAQRLHLSMRQIEALEQDDYRALPGATYVRGYLKSYALLLGIDPVPVLDAHSRMTAKPTPPPDFSNIAPQREITSRHHQVRIVTYLVVAVVIGLAIAWWQGRNAPATSSLVAMPNTEPAQAPVAAESSEGSASNALVVPADPRATPPAMVTPTPAAPVADTKPVVPAAPAAQQPVAAPTAKLATPPPAAQPPTAVPAPATPLPTGPRGKVVVHAEQDTWVDVRDAREVKLIYETVSAGRTVTLEGIAPIRVFLGNAAGARVEYNGRAVDIARHQRGMIARFVVGEEDTAPPTQR